MGQFWNSDHMMFGGTTMIVLWAGIILAIVLLMPWFNGRGNGVTAPESVLLSMFCVNGLPRAKSTRTNMRSERTFYPAESSYANRQIRMRKQARYCLTLCPA